MSTPGLDDIKGPNAKTVLTNHRAPPSISVKLMRYDLCLQIQKNEFSALGEKITQVLTADQEALPYAYVLSSQTSEELMAEPVC